MRLSPLDPRIPDVQTATAHAHFIAGRYDEASSWAEKALAEAIFAPALRVAAASNALAGRLGARAEIHDALAEAGSYAARFRSRGIDYRLSDRNIWLNFAEGLRKAGLPE